MVNLLAQGVPINFQVCQTVFNWLKKRCVSVLSSSFLLEKFIGRDTCIIHNASFLCLCLSKISNSTNSISYRLSEDHLSLIHSDQVPFLHRYKPLYLACILVLKPSMVLQRRAVLQMIYRGNINIFPGYACNNSSFSYAQNLKKEISIPVLFV